VELVVFMLETPEVAVEAVPEYPLLELVAIVLLMMELKDFFLLAAAVLVETLVLAIMLVVLVVRLFTLQLELLLGPLLAELVVVGAALLS
jgi:hypothetical protein